jgi:hypothetical protein
MQRYELDAELAGYVRRTVKQFANSFQPRPKAGRRPEQSDAMPPTDPAQVEDIRAQSYTTIAAATGNRTGPRTPGTGSAKLYIEPASGAPGVAWQLAPNPVQCENHMGDPVVPFKPILLKKGRIADGDVQIYIVVSEGCKEIPSSG